MSSVAGQITIISQSAGPTSTQGPFGGGGGGGGVGGGGGGEPSNSTSSLANSASLYRTFQHILSSYGVSNPMVSIHLPSHPRLATLCLGSYSRSLLYPSSTPSANGRRSCAERYLRPTNVSFQICSC